MFRRKSTMEQMLEDKRNVAELIVEIEDVVAIFQQTSKDCMEGAVEAAKLGHDEYSDELVETSAEIDAFIDDLQFVSLKLKQTAITADALSRLGNLDSALNSCKRLFQNAPDFNKIGKKMGDLTISMHSARDSLSDFRRSLSSSRDKSDAYFRTFGEKRDKKDPRYDQRIADKKKAVQLSVGASTVSAVATTSTKAADQETPAGMTDLAQMLGDESGKQ